ncbi:MAG: carbon-nitrogen hydrolase family protein [Thermoplasmata archaeon]
MASLEILLKQLNPINGIETNERLINETLTEKFDIAVFPEMFYSGYLLRDELNLLTVNQDFVRTLQKRIGGRMLIFGAPLKEGYLYNTAFVVTGESVKIYRKRHLPNFGPFEEMRYFQRGRQPLTVEFKGLKVGIEICYDLFFADSVENGIDVLINISASPFTSYPFFEKMLPARAIEAQSYVVYVNTAGLQRNQVFWGGSRVIDPDGKEVLLLKKFREDSGTAQVNSSAIEFGRRKRRVLSEVLDESSE